MRPGALEREVSHLSASNVVESNNESMGTYNSLNINSGYEPVLCKYKRWGINLKI